MREARLTAAGIDFVLGNKGDVVKLLSVEVEPKELAVLQDLRKGLVCVEMQGARVSGHKQCWLSLADDGKSTLKLDVVGQLAAEEIDGLRPLQRQSRAEEIAQVVAALGDGADREDIAEAVDDLLRFDAVVTPLQLTPEDVAREGLAGMKKSAEADGMGLSIKVGDGPEHVLAKPKKKPRRKKAAANKPGQNVMEIAPGEEPAEFAARAYGKLKGDMKAEGVEFSVSAGRKKRTKKAGSKKGS